MDALTLFGLLAVLAMLGCYALEQRSPWFVLAVWAVVALHRWRRRVNPAALR